MRVAAVLVVGDDDLRAELAQDPYQRLGRLLDRHQREAALRQRRRRIALRQPGVHEPEPLLLHAENLAGPLHLVAAHLGEVLPHVGTVHRRIEHRPGFAAGTRHDQHVSALGDVARHGRGALARLVVGMGMDAQQAAGGVGTHVSIVRPARP